MRFEYDAIDFLPTVNKKQCCGSRFGRLGPDPDPDPGLNK
jgi:hypothetical protein